MKIVPAQFSASAYLHKLIGTSWFLQMLNFKSYSNILLPLPPNPNPNPTFLLFFWAKNNDQRKTKLKETRNYATTYIKKKFEKKEENRKYFFETKRNSIYTAEANFYFAQIQIQNLEIDDLIL